jgi:hypothetical protein
MSLILSNLRVNYVWQWIYNGVVRFNINITKWFPLIFQIHDRITYLRHLIVSLAQARGISQALLVFSHDYYDEEINNLVQSVDFCKVIQIFYPYSIQTHPHEFPGEDPNDCPRDIKREQWVPKNGTWSTLDASDFCQFQSVDKKV